MQATDDTILPPGWAELALEGRAPWELGATLLSLPILLSAPRGDGHPVLVYPGLGLGDPTTLVLRWFIASRGYKPHPWKLGINRGPFGRLRGSLLKQLRQIHAEHGQKASLIGWSLGGLYARELARRAPEAVRCVITLGAPFAGEPKATNGWRLYEYLSGNRAEDDFAEAQPHRPLPVPCTSIYSRSDGIVAWKCSVQRQAPRSENIAVPASHIGMGVNPAVLYAIADRLAQPEGDWRPFELRGLRRFLYG